MSDDLYLLAPEAPAALLAEVKAVAAAMRGPKA